MCPLRKKEELPPFVSRQVTDARRFFLNLNPSRSAALEVVCGGVERMGADYVVRRNDFPYLAIEFVAEGKGTLSLEGDRRELRAGSVFAYGPGASHMIRSDRDSPMRKFYLDFCGRQARNLLRSAGLLSNDGRYQLMSIGWSHELSELFEILIREGSGEGPQVLGICETLIRLMILKLQQRRLMSVGVLPQSQATFERIRRFIEGHYLDCHSAKEVAARCHVTPIYLSRLFQRFSDCGAYHYLLRRKMNHAAGLLVNDGLLVKEVADRLGYPDAYQFSRAFKRVFGIPPRQLLAAQI